MAVHFSTGKLPQRSLSRTPSIPVKSVDLVSFRNLCIDALAKVGQASAADAIQDSVLSIDGEGLILIEMPLSKTMLPVVVNKDASHVLSDVLAKNFGANYTFKLLPDANMGAKRGLGIKANEKIARFEKLSASAAKLNEVSDKLSAQVQQIDAALKRLNLGVTTWVKVEETQDEDGNWSLDEVGYTRIGSRWGVALRSSQGLLGDPNPPDCKFWGFCDAPRQFRIRAVPAIPQLIDDLSTEAEKMILSLSAKVDEVAYLTEGLNSIGAGDR